KIALGRRALYLCFQYLPLERIKKEHCKESSVNKVISWNEAFKVDTKLIYDTCDREFVLILDLSDLKDGLGEMLASQVGFEHLNERVQKLVRFFGAAILRTGFKGGIKDIYPPEKEQV
ncbi:MAG: hypothetical protein OEV93_01695, partial [Candidatus Moranbacteria bacterium]|nr:hypothetical protein [Candidatus Moranbacteria bacterium]